MTLLELTIALCILVVGLLGFLQSLLSAMALHRAQRDDAVVSEIARQTIANLQATPFAQVFVRYNSSAADDPGGVVSPGANVAVPGLRALPTDADGIVGRIDFPTSPGPGGVPMLREDLAFPEFGTPRDLNVNGDGAIDGFDHATNYTVLPVALTFDWLSAKGPRHIEFRTILAGY
jgi:type II secretory pathway pseudopilin PulG